MQPAFALTQDIARDIVDKSEPLSKSARDRVKDALTTLTVVRT